MFIRNKPSIFINSVMAGICIGIGCNIYLSCNNKYIGAALFAVGLMTILAFDFNLYTGKVGYIVLNNLSFALNVLVILIGNIVGCIILGLAFPSEMAAIMCTNKLLVPYTSVIYKSIMCGLLMFIAVDSYKKFNSYVLTFLCIPTFILSGYEHSIADIIYFIMGRVYSIEAVCFILLVIFGNAIGGMIIPFCKKYF